MSASGIAHRSQSKNEAIAPALACRFSTNALAPCMTWPTVVGRGGRSNSEMLKRPHATWKRCERMKSGALGLPARNLIWYSWPGRKKSKSAQKVAYPTRRQMWGSTRLADHQVCEGCDAVPRCDDCIPMQLW
eukprot:1556619-Rhodomonas_salina.4